MNNLKLIFWFGFWMKSTSISVFRRRLLRKNDDFFTATTTYSTYSNSLKQYATELILFRFFHFRIKENGNEICNDFFPFPFQSYYWFWSFGKEYAINIRYYYVIIYLLLNLYICCKILIKFNLMFRFSGQCCDVMMGNGK